MSFLFRASAQRSFNRQAKFRDRPGSVQGGTVSKGVRVCKQERADLEQDEGVVSRRSLEG